MKIALVGNQNCGKTTLFNELTGMNAKIGNWPGVTIEKKSGFIKNTNYEILDLPGIYSLSPYSTEEEISRKFILDENVDLIINIVDGTALERSLYLTLQLLETDCNVIIALNMADILEKKGIIIDDKMLGEILDVDVVRISALKGTGIKTLIKKIDNVKIRNKQHIFSQDIENIITKISNKINSKNKRFISIKLLENDEKFQNYLTNELRQIIDLSAKSFDMDFEELIATERYNYIEKINNKVTKRKIIRKSFSDKLDKIFLNKFLAFPIFIAIMFLVYYLSVGVVGNYTINFIENIFNNISISVNETLLSIHTSNWLRSLIVDGIIRGISAVLNFVPQLIILFFCISILETTGYMSRISLLLDKFFNKIGLSGKSLIPFIVGSGCSVPGIMTSRIIENQNARKTTIMLTPFIPCSAKLPIIALFSGYFFKENSGFVSASLYFLSIVVIIISALILKKFTYKNVSNAFISELPEYKLPNLKYVLKDVFDKVIAFIKRAGSVIFISSVVIWALLSFSTDFKYGVDIDNSILAKIGEKISFAFYPILGVNSWEATVSALQGLVAKEQVVSSMAIINGLSENVIDGSQIFSLNGSFNFFTKASAYAFLVFNLFSAPCIGALSAMKKELGGFLKMLKAAIFQTCIAWILSFLIYQVR